MNKGLIKIIFGTSCFILAFGSCKKYGFDDPDGYADYSDTLTHAIGDTSLNKADYSFISQAAIFPGLVPLTEDRIDTAININLSYNIVTTEQLKVQSLPSPLNSVGLYAAPGEPIEVIVPEGINGLTAQIGPWSDDLSAKDNPGRYNKISASFTLYPGINYIRNPFGGNIFISPKYTQDKTIKVQVVGAVKSPDFVLGQTTDDQWVAEMQATKVPNFILRGKHVAFVLQTSLYRNSPFSNPTDLMTYWDWIYEHVFFKYTGLELNASDPRDQAPQLPEYYVFDKDISAGYWHSGFPIMVISDLNNFKTVTDLNYVKNVGSWGALHENGHNMQMPRIFDVSSVMGETSNNLYSVFLAHETGISYKTLLEGRDNVDIAFDFINSTTDTSITQLTDPFAKIVFYDQIFNKVQNGWDFWPYLYKKARRQTRNSFSDIERWSFLYSTLCDFAQMDMISFFSAWKIPVSTAAQVEAASKYSALTTDIWNYNPVTEEGGDKSVIGVADDNSTWKIADYSSEETSGEGAVNGHIAAVIDGDANTYWHSNWTGSSPGYPHYITFDMRTQITFNGMYFIQRSASSGTNGVVKSLSIYFSNDNASWTQVYSGDLNVSTKDKQMITFSTPAKGRYVKVQFDASANGAQFAAMSEIGGF